MAVAIAWRLLTRGRPRGASVNCTPSAFTARRTPPGTGPSSRTARPVTARLPSAVAALPTVEREALGRMRIASLRLRLLAALVDGAVVIGGLLVWMGLTMVGFAAYDRVRGKKDELDGEADGGVSESHATREFRLSPQLKAALWGGGAGLEIASRGWRSPGFRVVGLRRVDARTGAIVSVRSVLTGLLFDQARQAVTTSLFGSRARRERDRIVSLGPQLKAIPVLN